MILLSIFSVLNVTHFSIIKTSCRLEDCLEDYTRLEILKDCICRNCSIKETHKRLLHELQTLRDALESPAPTATAMPGSSPTKNKPSPSKKKRFKEVKRMEQRIKQVITDGRIEEDALLEGIRLEKVFSPASTKQAMIARVRYMFNLTEQSLIRTIPASSRSRITPQQICSLWAVRGKKYHPSLIPRNTRSNTLHDIRESIHSPNKRDFNPIPSSHTPSLHFTSSKLQLKRREQ